MVGYRDSRASGGERQGALNLCALQDRHTKGAAVDGPLVRVAPTPPALNDDGIGFLLTGVLILYCPITTDTPPGSAGNRTDTRTPVWALARSRPLAEGPGHKSLAAARTRLRAAVCR